MQLNWRLRVLMVRSIGVRRKQRTQHNPVDSPGQALRRPLPGIRVELGLRVGHSRLRAAVVGARYTFSEVIRLDSPGGLGEVVAGKLPVDLVEVIGDEDDAGDDALAGGGLSDNVDFAEEEVVGCPDVGRVRGLVKGELSAVGAVGDVFVGGEGPTWRERGEGGEIGGEGSGETGLGRA